MSVDDMVRERIETLLIASPLAKKLGLRLDTLEPDLVRIAMPFDKSNVTVGRIVHGGAITALMDTAGAAASASAANMAEVTGGATSNLAISFIAAAEGVDLVAEAAVIQRSSRQTVSDISVRAGDGTLVAKGMVTSRIFTAKR